MNVTKFCYLTGPQPAANTTLATALMAAYSGLTVTVEPWPQTKPGHGTWLLLLPMGSTAITEYPWTACKYYVLGLDWPITEQVTNGLIALGLGPGQNDPAGKMGNMADHT